MNTNSIHIGSVRVPLLDYAVSCTAILGIRDSGKTVTAKGIAEQLLEHEIPIVVFDAVGKWRWMKVPGPGKHGKGYKVVVAGGRAPDLALTPHSVAEIVRSAVKERIPLIIDLYDPKLSKADWRRIVQQSIRIIHYEANGVAHVFLEEAAEFIPQKVMDGETYAEVEKLARMGGNASVGITLINQRSQEVNKAVLDLAHNLVLGCQIGNKAIEAVEKWVDRLSPDTAKAVTTSLPKLASGEAWVWTRSNPDDPKRERLPMCRSLHPDRRTPDVVLKSAAAINPEEFVERLAASIPKVIEEAKANDPAALKREIAKLRRELESNPKVVEAKPLPAEKVFVVRDEDMATIRDVASRCEILESALDDSKERARELFKELNSIHARLLQLKNVSPSAAPRWRPKIDTAPRRERASIEVTNIPRASQKILDALAWLESIGVSNPSTVQVGAVAQIDPTGGYFSNSVGPLSSAGLVHRANGVITLTADGRLAARQPESEPTLAAYHDMLCERVRKLGSNKTADMLRFIVNAGEPITTQALGEAVSIDPSGGYFSNTIGPLGTLGLIRRNSGVITPTDILFPPGLS